MTGWIKLHRELIEKPIWQKANSGQKVVLITLLLLANHESSCWEWQGEQFICKSGQLITSIETLQKASGATKQNIRSALLKFEKYGFLTNQSTKTGRLVTLVNWNNYQGKNDEPTKQPTKNQQRTNKDPTNNPTPNKKLRTKEFKNDKNKEIYIPNFLEFQKVKISKEEFEKLNEKLGQATTEQFMNRLDVYLEQTGRLYKSHYATILTWWRKDGEPKEPIKKENWWEADSIKPKEVIIENWHEKHERLTREKEEQNAIT